MKDGRVVKGVNFINFVDAGDPVENAKFYESEGADELVFLDITASSDRRSIMLEVVKSVAEAINIPFTVGGGIRTIEDIELVLESGVDKISINTAAVENPQLISESAQKFGSQHIVVAIDVKQTDPNKWAVLLHGGRTFTDLNVIDWAKQAEALGAGEILLTSMDKDGTKSGYDIPITRAVADAVSIPVVASGGVGTIEHMYEAFIEGRADAVLAASVFHFREISIPNAKKELNGRGIPVRLM
jgi:cyclase